MDLGRGAREKVSREGKERQLWAVNWGHLVPTCGRNRVIIRRLWVLYCVCGIGLVVDGGLGAWREVESE